MLTGDPAVDGDDDWGYDYDSESGWNDDYIHNNQHWIRYDYSGQNNNYVRCDLVNGKWVFSYHIWNLTQTTKYTMKSNLLCTKMHSPKQYLRQLLRRSYRHMITLYLAKSKRVNIMLVVWRLQHPRTELVELE